MLLRNFEFNFNYHNGVTMFITISPRHGSLKDIPQEKPRICYHNDGGTIFITTFPQYGISKDIP